MCSNKFDEARINCSGAHGMKAIHTCPGGYRNRVGKWRSDNFPKLIKILEKIRENHCESGLVASLYISIIV